MAHAGTLQLDRAPVDQAVIIAGTCPDPATARRLTGLGWRPGGRVRVVGRAAGGAHVIELNEARVAISRRLARTLTVEPERD